MNVLQYNCTSHKAETLLVWCVGNIHGQSYEKKQKYSRFSGAFGIFTS